MKNCPFYGFYLSAQAKLMVPQNGNQCALITTSYGPCKMEFEGKECNWTECGLNNETSMGTIADVVVIAEEEQMPVKDWMKRVIERITN